MRINKGLVVMAVVAVSATGCTHGGGVKAEPAAHIVSTPTPSAVHSTLSQTPDASPTPSRMVTPSSHPHGRSTPTSTSSSAQSAPTVRKTVSAARRVPSHHTTESARTHKPRRAVQSRHPHGRSEASSTTQKPVHATATPTRKPHPAPAKTVATYAPGTHVSWRTSRQVMVADHTSGTDGTWARYQWEGSSRGWVKMSPSGAVAHFGKHGVKPGSRRVQGDMTTPAGTYGFVTAFGSGNPGTKMPYRKIDSCSWWIGDPAASDYNRWRQDCRSLSRSDNEHLADYVHRQYIQGAALDFNYYSPVRHGRGSGSAIFLHYATNYTAGCVGLESVSELKGTLRWMDPAQNPRIVIKA